jgi:hypothetical protein
VTVSTRACLFTFVALGTLPVAVPDAYAKDDDALTRARILTVLMTHALEPLKGHPHCASFTGVQGGKSTVGGFIAWNLAFMERGVDNAVTVRCEPWQDGAYWRRGRSLCEVSFNADSKGESPWSCGLRFERDDATNSVDAKTLQCIGTC